MSKHQELMNQAYDRWNKEGRRWSKEEFHDSLNQWERFAVHTGNMNQQVENGGFMQWFDNCYGTPSTVKFLLRAMKRMDTEVSQKVSDLLTKYRTIVGERDARKHASEYDECDWEEMHDRLSELDTEYYKINDSFLIDCESHLQNGGW